MKSLKTRLAEYLSSLLGIEQLHHDLLAAKLRIKALEGRLAEETEIHANVGFGGDICTVFVAGRLNKHDYVQLFRIEPEDFNHLVDMLRSMEKHLGHLKFVDSRIGYSELIKREVRNC